MTWLAKRLSVLLTVAFAVTLSIGGPARAAPSAQDAEFLRATHQSNLVVISIGQLAQQKAVTDQVRSLGARFAANHTELDRVVTQAAAALSVSLPEIPTAEQEVIMRRLQVTTGTEFDRMFLAVQLQAHQTAMRLGAAEMTSGSDPAAKKVAADAAPVFKAHHDALGVAMRELGVPDEVDTGSGGTAAPRDNQPLGMLLVGVGLAAAAFGTFLLLRRRSRR